MKTLFNLMSAAIIIAGFAGVSVKAQNFDTVFKVGVNWMAFDTNLIKTGLRSTFDNALGCNVYHSFYAAGSWYAPAFANAGSPTHLIVEDNTISNYAASECVIYQALNVPTNADSLKSYYFLYKDTTNGFFNTTLNVWQEDSSGVLTTCDTILYNNQIIDGPWPYSGMWRSYTCTPFRLAVKFKVNSVDTSSTDTVLKIDVRQDRDSSKYYGHGGITDALVHTWSIPWKNVKTTNDTVMIDTFFNFDYTSLASYHDPSHLASDIKLYVSSQLPVTERISWVAVMSSPADSLLIGAIGPAGLGSTDSNWIKAYDTIKSRITTAYTNDVSTLNSSLYKVYLSDEPSVAEFTSHTRCNQILNGLGETERSTVALAAQENIGEHAVIYLNRLSDLLFVLARYENTMKKVEETKWGG